MADRAHDVVLFGATGFTGALTAGQIAASGPPGLRWALAGRSRDKLERVRDRVAADHPDAAVPELIEADVTDARRLREVAASTAVVATTVGRLLLHGEGLVAACAAEGTGYVDLTGEPEFVDRVWLDHHATASRTGARIVHACGFDSIPHDLGAQFTVEQLPEGVPITVDGYVRAAGTASGGTYHSAIGQFSRARQYAGVAKARKRAEGRPADGRRVRLRGGRIRFEPAVNAWAVPLPTIDPQVVGRSAAALERYGPEFTYGHWAAVKRLPIAVGGVAGVGALFALAQLPPTRGLLLKAKAVGTGPSEEQIAKGWFCVRFVGEGGGRRVVTEVTGGDPGYGATSQMLAQAALCLALDDLPETAGQVTPAVAMGARLRERLVAEGFGFDVVEAPAV